MPSSRLGFRTDRERAIGSVEAMSAKHEIAATAFELVGNTSGAQGRRKLVTELHKVLASLRAGVK
jgi:hypothetical protein